MSPEGDECITNNKKNKIITVYTRFFNSTKKTQCDFN